MPVVLRLYDASEGGVLIYTDSNDVEVAGGLYSTFIGDDLSGGSLKDALTNSQVWIEPDIGGTVLLPRERLAAVAYAMMSADVTNGAIRGSMFEPGAVQTNHLLNSIVTADKIAAGAVGAAALADGAVEGSNIADGAVTSAKIASNSASSFHLARSYQSGRIDVLFNFFGTDTNLSTLFSPAFTSEPPSTRSRIPPAARRGMRCPSIRT